MSFERPNESAVHWLSSARDRDFLQRVYATPAEVYAQRLRRIGFAGHGRVLDAGCGMGQWSLALAALNGAVFGVDCALPRLRAAAQVCRERGVGNVAFAAGDIAGLAFGADRFDAVFCYSAVYYADFRRALAEFRRVLRPGGLLYFCANGLGWYVHNLVNRPNPSADCDPRTLAITALANSLEYYAGGHKGDGDLVIPSAFALARLRELGFADLERGDEGSLGAGPGRPFFQGRYFDTEGVYEVRCRKPG